LIDVLENVRLGYLDLCQAGTTRAELQHLNLESRPSNPEDKHQEHGEALRQAEGRDLPRVAGILRANWDERFLTTKYDWRDVPRPESS